MDTQDKKNIFFQQTKEIKLASQTKANVLITGPTGSGKSTLAQYIHEQSERSKMPFVSINLACLHPHLIESELFGHERGAFTGATEKKKGLLESAQGGTAFLDEIAELPITAQQKLLDFLQNKSIKPVGSNKTLQLNVRIIAATHQNIVQQVENKHFRADLFHRMNIIPIRLEPLSTRTDEFNDILHSCLEAIGQEHGKKIISISEEVAQVLETYSWPGNIRELRNILEYSVLSSQNGRIKIENLPLLFMSQKTAESESNIADYHGALKKFEKDLVLGALVKSNWRIHRAARSLKISCSTLKRKVKQHRLAEKTTRPL